MGNHVSRLHDAHLRRGYRLRVLGGLVVSLAAVICVLQFWPALSTEPAKTTYATDGQERVQIQDVRPTRHGQRTPPPPAPLPPVVRPDDEVLQPLALNLDRNQLTLDAPPVSSPNGTPDDDGKDAPPKQVQVSPRPVRIVEPQYTERARSENVRASVTVKVLVDRFGHVKEASITKRSLLNKQREPTRRVEKLGYGLEDAALSAARRWQFRPARQNGEAVRSYTTVTLSFGI